MKIDYWRSKFGNFGDDLNGWLWGEILPGLWDPNDGIRFIGIGTVIDQKLDTSAFTVIFGSGAGYGTPPKTLGNTGLRKIYCVRGPLTAKTLGLAPQLALTDPAILLADIERFQKLERNGVIFVPHWNSVSLGQWPKICRAADIDFVDPRQDSEIVIRKIGSSSLVLAESMHAAIIADALRVPWIPVATSLEFLPFKWADWSLSLGLDFHTYLLSPSSVQEVIRNLLLLLSQGRGTFTSVSFSNDVPAKVNFSDEGALFNDVKQVYHRHTQRWRYFYTRIADAVIGKLLKTSHQFGPYQYKRALKQMLILRGMPGRLSNDERHLETIKAVRAKLDEMRDDYRSGTLGRRSA